MTAQNSGPRISVCIATFNEGPDLEATIATVYASKYQPHEVIVCDDNSEQDPKPRLASWLIRDNFKYIRNAKRLGSGPTKQNALDAATGDVLVILDSHMRPYHAWLNMIAQANMKHPNDFLCTESVGFTQPYQGQFYGRGAYFEKGYYKHGAHTVQWCPASLFEDYQYPRIGAMHGGCYIFPRYQLEKIGGYAPLLKGWGYEEEWIAFRAAAHGIETRLISGCPVPHQYERSLHRRSATPETKPQGWEPLYNRHAVAIAAFGHTKHDAIYRQRIINGSEVTMRKFVEEELAEASERIAAFRKTFSATTLPAEVWMRRLGIEHPEPEEPDEYGIPEYKNESPEPPEGAVTPDPALIESLRAQGPQHAQGAHLVPAQEES